jgi:hypothetical protein
MVLLTPTWFTTAAGPNMTRTTRTELKCLLARTTLCEPDVLTSVLLSSLGAHSPALEGMFPTGLETTFRSGISIGSRYPRSCRWPVCIKSLLWVQM